MHVGGVRARTSVGGGSGFRSRSSRCTCCHLNRPTQPMTVCTSHADPLGRAWLAVVRPAIHQKCVFAGCSLAENGIPIDDASKAVPSEVRHQQERDLWPNLDPPTTCDGYPKHRPRFRLRPRSHCPGPGTWPRGRGRRRRRSPPGSPQRVAVLVGIGANWARSWRMPKRCTAADLRCGVRP